MATQQQTAGEELARQQAIIYLASERLRVIAQDIIYDHNPETATWADVAKYAHIVAAVNTLNESLGE